MESITFVNEPVMVMNDDGDIEPYIPLNITTAREAYSASLDMIYKHVAEFHVAIVNIIADKYNLSADEIINEVVNDERYKNVFKETNSLGYIDNNTVPKEEPKVARKVVKRKVRITADPEIEAKQDEKELSENMNKMVIDTATADPPKKRVYKKKTVDASA